MSRADLPPVVAFVEDNSAPHPTPLAWLSLYVPEDGGYTWVMQTGPFDGEARVARARQHAKDRAKKAGRRLVVLKTEAEHSTWRALARPT